MLAAIGHLPRHAMVVDQLADKGRVELRPLFQEVFSLFRGFGRELLLHQLSQLGIDRGRFEAVVAGLASGIGVGRLGRVVLRARRVAVGRNLVGRL